MRALITGGNGFIGSHLAAALAERGDEVCCLVRSTSDTRSLARARVRTVRGDVRDPGSLRAAVAGADCVFHLAAVITARDWRAYRAVNAEGTRNLVAACADAAPDLARFVLVSSIGAAGPSSCDAPLTERDECRPVSDYGRSKQLAEEEVRRGASRLPIAVVRPANVLGPRQRELWQVMRLIRRGIVPVVGTPGTRTSIVGIEDLVRALVAAAEHPRAVGQTYLVAHRQAHSWQEIATETARALGARAARVKIPYAAQYALAAAAELAAWATRTTPPLRRDHLQATRRYCWLYDPSKIEAELGVRATTDLPAILGATVAWYRDRGLL